MPAHSKIDARRRADNLVSALGRAVGLPDVALDANNSVSLSFNDDRITLTYEQELDGFALFTLADRLPGPLGLQGLVGLMEFNEELFFEKQAHVLYNEWTLMVAALFRVDASTLKADSILPWIDQCLVTLGTIRERIWELIGADREAYAEDGEGTTTIR